MSGDEWTIPDLPTPPATPPAIVDLTKATRMIQEAAHLARTAPTSRERDRYADRVIFGTELLKSVTAGIEKTHLARQTQPRA
jgi:hypothetical protein